MSHRSVRWEAAHVPSALCLSLVFFFVNRFKQLSVIAVILLIAGCTGEPPPKYYGFLYFGAGEYLGKFSLRDGSSSIVKSVGEANIRDVEELEGARVLLSIDAMENDREVSRIIWVDVATFQDKSLYGGVTAVWLPELHTYIYDDETRLSAASASRDFATDNVIMDHRINGLIEILVVSPWSAIFEIGRDERRKIWHYDAGTAELTEMEQFANVCSLRHSVWIARDKEVACRSEVTGEYMRVSLDGDVGDVIELPEGKEFEAIEYVADQNLLVFVERWNTAVINRPRAAVWVHELDTGVTVRIAKHQHLGRSTAYLRE